MSYVLYPVPSLSCVTKLVLLGLRDKTFCTEEDTAAAHSPHSSLHSLFSHNSSLLPTQNIGPANRTGHLCTGRHNTLFQENSWRLGCFLEVRGRHSKWITRGWREENMDRRKFQRKWRCGEASWREGRRGMQSSGEGGAIVFWDMR